MTTQTPQARGTRGKDMIDILIDDHREADELFAELESGRGSVEHRRDLADTVTAELVRHSVAEEEYLYPAARRALSDGQQVAEHEISEHAEAERTMKELEGVAADDPRFDELCRKLAAEIRHHVEEEENDLFPRLREACAEQELAELGKAVEAAKSLAPTRPHPQAPDRPPWNKLLAPGAGFVDRVRDALSGRATSREDLDPDRGTGFA